MTETQGLIAGSLLLFAAFVYTFWPENVFASQREKTRLDYLLERKEQLYENLRDLNFEYSAGKYPEEDFKVQRGNSGRRDRATAGRDRSLAAGVVTNHRFFTCAKENRRFFAHHPRTERRSGSRSLRMTVSFFVVSFRDMTPITNR